MYGKPSPMPSAIQYVNTITLPCSFHSSVTKIFIRWFTFQQQRQERQDKNHRNKINPSSILATIKETTLVLLLSFSPSLLSYASLSHQLLTVQRASKCYLDENMRNESIRFLLL